MFNKKINRKLLNLKIVVLTLMLYGSITAFKGQKECDLALQNKDFITAFNAFNQIDKPYLKKSYEEQIRTVFKIPNDISLQKYADFFNPMLQEPTKPIITLDDDDGLSESSDSSKNNQDFLAQEAYINQLEDILETTRAEYNSTLKTLLEDQADHKKYSERKKLEIEQLKKQIDILNTRLKNQNKESVSPLNNNCQEEIQNLKDQLNFCKEDYQELQRVFNKVSYEKLKQDQEIRDLEDNLMGSKF